ncbi:MAG: hypothetical protein DI604_17935 [Delftia acidovorans]|nr:MAG: hypothetical protein DI604_17935 [Delftia acidovorans]
MAKFHVDYRFHGRASRTIEGSSKEEAESLIEEEVNADDFEIEADEIDDIDFSVRELHPVTRDGREIWSTYVTNTDVRGHQSAMTSSPLFSEAD